MKKKIFLKISFFLILLLLPLFFQYDITQGQVETEETEVKEIISKPTLQEQIPGLDLTDAADIPVKEKSDGKYLVVPYLGEYISAVYKWSIAAAGILAVIVIIISAIQWMFPALNLFTEGEGNQQQTINQAKSRILRSIAGLVIAVSSYTLLYTINPELVQFDALEVKFVEKKTIEETPDDIYSTGKNPPSDTKKKVLCPDEKELKEKISEKQYAKAKTEYLGHFDRCYQPKKYKRSLSSINTIVVHEGASSIEGTIRAWEYASKQTNDKEDPYGITAHYTIERNGVVHQILDEKIAGNHAGAANSQSIGIDLAIPSGCSQSRDSDNFNTCANYTSSQYSSLKDLISNIISRTNVTLDDQHTIGHCQVPGSTHADPRNFDYSKINLNNSAHWSEWRPNKKWSGKGCKAASLP